MYRIDKLLAPRTLCLAMLAGALALPADSFAQARSGRTPSGGSATLARRVPSTLPQGKYVVVDLDKNEVRFMDGRTVLWAAPAGTGTGLRLQGKNGEWDFATPNGEYQVQYKEQNPVWIAPDWYFIEKKLPIPPEDSPARRQPGGLGAAAVYIDRELAIHGTDKPELLGQRVSHGCIRLSDEYAMRLFHNVQIGTPVLITGNAPATPDPVSASAPVVPLGAKKPPVKERPLTGTGTTAALISRLDQQLRRSTRSGWTETASQLIARAQQGDVFAAVGLLEQSWFKDEPAFEQEYATFLTDAYMRAPQTVLAALGKLDREVREHASTMIVSAAMDLYHGKLADVRTPWPTRRLPPGERGRDAALGADALRVAETAYRRANGVI
ncbi:MAG: L,D-transpeptidase family protein [Gemmatimonadota bacterium]|nr:L,D-transpeptidase family protein [Gemmatimonadota bacterium]